MGMQQGDGEVGRFWGLSEQVIAACIHVHRELGPGLLESAYERCLAHELSARSLVIEIKAIERLLPLHEAQLLTYLKLTGIHAGLLINFNAPTLKQGLRRLTLK